MRSDVWSKIHSKAGSHWSEIVYKKSFVLWCLIYLCICFITTFLVSMSSVPGTISDGGSGSGKRPGARGVTVSSQANTAQKLVNPFLCPCK